MLLNSLFQSGCSPTVWRTPQDQVAHYTTEKNIAQTSPDSLFLDDLRAEFQAIRACPMWRGTTMARDRCQDELAIHKPLTAASSAAGMSLSSRWLSSLRALELELPLDLNPEGQRNLDAASFSHIARRQVLREHAGIVEFVGEDIAANDQRCGSLSTLNRRTSSACRSRTSTSTTTTRTTSP